MTESWRSGAIWDVSEDNVERLGIPDRIKVALVVGAENPIQAIIHVMVYEKPKYPFTSQSPKSCPLVIVPNTDSSAIDFGALTESDWSTLVETYPRATVRVTRSFLSQYY